MKFDGLMSVRVVAVSVAFLSGFGFISQSDAVILKVPAKYKTIQKAINAAQPDDVVQVAQGTYKERIKLKAGVHLKGAGPELTVITGGGRGTVVEGADNAVLEGFTIRGSGPRGKTGVTPDVGISANHVTMTIRNNRITGNNIGIRTYFSPSHITGNIIEGNKWHGIYVLYSAPLIRNNIIYRNKGNGIYCSYSSNTEINNNTIGPNGSPSLFCEVSRVIVRNNIVVNNNSHGIMWAEFPDMQQGVEPILSYNLVMNNHDDYYRVKPGIGDVSADPLFVDAAKGDFHLKPGSPAINAGDPAGAFNDPDGTRNDIGAYGGPVSPGGVEDVAKVAKRHEKMTEVDYTGQATWAGDKESGKGNFMQFCAQCHGKEGRGDGPVAQGLDTQPRDLADGNYLKHRTDDELFKTIKEGGVASGFSESMMPFGNFINDETIRKVIAFIRQDICKCGYTKE